MSDSSRCPLCHATEGSLFYTDARRHYLRCCRCALVYVPPIFYLSQAAERAEYDKHENSVDDAGYRTFLSRLFNPLEQILPPASCGLDFGCGPGPALAKMLSEAGHRVALYDPFYAPDKRPFEDTHDFICATEVVEHLHRPGVELSRLWRQLATGGVLAIMTKMVLDRAAFSRWHYKNDLTHVCFFSRQTWRWWAQQYSARVTFPAADVIFLMK